MDAQGAPVTCGRSGSCQLGSATGGFFLDLVGTCWDQVYVAEIKGIWTQDILDAHREQQLKSQAV